jgi:hypothetical protein
MSTEPKIIDRGPTSGRARSLPIHKPVEEFTHCKQELLTLTDEKFQQQRPE